MARYIVLASFDRKPGTVTYGFDTHHDPATDPPRVTLGFRQVFWKCFSDVWTDALEAVPVKWLGRTFRVHHVAYFESIGTALSETEGEMFAIAFVVSTTGKSDESFGRIRQLSGLNEQEAIFALLAALPEAMRTSFTDAMAHSHDFPGLAVLKVSDQYKLDVKSALLLFGFFYCGKLMLWRIRRDQADINISLLQHNFRGAIFLTAIQRSRIINIKRFQLTSNTSNDPDVQAGVKHMKEHLNLEREYENDEELNTLVEEYLASLEKLFSEENRRRIERGVAVFSFIAVPFTVFAAFIAVIGLRDDLVVYRSVYNWAVNGGVWLLLAISIALPTFIYLATFLVDREEKVAQRLSRYRARGTPGRRR
jgi:hypothetical protein